MEETKRDKFKRLCESRMNNALKQIELLGNLSNTNAYEFNLEDVEKMVKTLRKAVSELDKTFKEEHKKKFSLEWKMPALAGIFYIL